MENKVSVIIPIYNGEKTIDKCLKSILKNPKYVKEIILIDDNSTDKSVEKAKKYSCNIIRLNQHKGPAEARNIGAAYAESEVLFFTDADVEILPDTIECGLKQIQQHPELSAIIGSYVDDTSVENFVSQYKNFLHHYTHSSSEGEVSSFFTACGFIRKSVFEQIEGFDRNITTTALEDVELGIRLRKSGYKIFLNKSIQVRHLKKYTLYSLTKSDVFNRAVPFTKLFIKYKFFKVELSTGVNNIISVFSMYILILLEILMFLKKVKKCRVQRIIIPFILIFTNLKLYISMKRKYNILFMMKGILLHWFGIIYSGLGVMIGICSFIFTDYLRLNKRNINKSKCNL